MKKKTEDTTFFPNTPAFSASRRAFISLGIILAIMALVSLAIFLPVIGPFLIALTLAVSKLLGFTAMTSVLSSASLLYIAPLVGAVAATVATGLAVVLNGLIAVGVAIKQYRHTKRELLSLNGLENSRCMDSDKDSNKKKQISDNNVNLPNKTPLFYITGPWKEEYNTVNFLKPKGLDEGITEAYAYFGGRVCRCTTENPYANFDIENHRSFYFLINFTRSNSSEKELKHGIYRISKFTTHQLQELYKVDPTLKNSSNLKDIPVTPPLFGSPPNGEPNSKTLPQIENK